MNKNRTSPLSSPVTAVLAGAFMISFSAVWVTLAEVEPATSAFYRVFFGFLFLFAAKSATGEHYLDFRRHLVPATLCGLAFAFDLYLWHASIRYIGPGLATIIGNFQVFLMACCGTLFFGERVTARFLLSLPLAFFGLFLIIGFDWATVSGDYRKGLFLGLLTACCYTVFLLLLRNIQSGTSKSVRYSPLMLISLTTALFLAVGMLINGDTFAISSIKSGLSLLSLGLCSQAVGWILIGISMPKIPPSFTGLVLLLQPSLAFLWDVLFFGRPTDPLNWAGTVITLWAIYLGLTGSRKST